MRAHQHVIQSFWSSRKLPYIYKAAFGRFGEGLGIKQMMKDLLNWGMGNLLPSLVLGFSNNALSYCGQPWIPNKLPDLSIQSGREGWRYASPVF